MTSCFICKEQVGGKLLGIYCYKDGYLKYCGKILNENYKDAKKVDELIALGDLDLLGKNIVSEQIDGLDACVAYSRDFGDDYSDVSASEITLDYVRKNGCNYVYVFGLDNKWRFYYMREKKPELHDLQEALSKENEM